MKNWMNNLIEYSTLYRLKLLNKSRQTVNQTLYFVNFAYCIKSYIMEFIPDLNSYDILDVCGDDTLTYVKVQYEIYGKTYEFTARIKQEG